MRFTSTQWLAAYSVVLTLGLVAVGLMAAAPRALKLDELDVQRINVREPDGRLRMVIAGRGRFPGAIMRGRETPFDRQSAGMLFYNDEDTENGGLIFSGSRAPDGRVTGGGSLSFDQYQQDEVVVLDQTEDAGSRHAGLTVFDRPDTSLDIASGVAMHADPAKLRAAVASGAFGHPRASLGKTDQRDAVLVLRDGQGRPRLRLSVSAAGDARIVFLDARGRATRMLAPS